VSARARVTQRDLGRVLREARKLGAVRVHIDPDGSIDIFLDDGKTAEAAVREPSAPPVKPFELWK
jgi:hypothetical protein